MNSGSPPKRLCNPQLMSPRSDFTYENLGKTSVKRLSEGLFPTQNTSLLHSLLLETMLETQKLASQIRLWPFIPLS